MLGLRIWALLDYRDVHSMYDGAIQLRDGVVNVLGLCRGLLLFFDRGDRMRELWYWNICCIDWTEWLHELWCWHRCRASRS